MLDRNARDTLIELLEPYIGGRLAAEKSTLLKLFKSKDAAVRAVLSATHDVFEWPASFLDDDSPTACPTPDEVSRYVLFLRTDREYDWKAPDVPWWLILLAPVFLAVLVYVTALAVGVSELIRQILAEVGIHIHEELSLVGLLMIVCAVTALVYRVRKKADMEVWPFFRRADYDQAVRHHP